MADKEYCPFLEECRPEMLEEMIKDKPLTQRSLFDMVLARRISVQEDPEVEMMFGRAVCVYTGGITYVIAFSEIKEDGSNLVDFAHELLHIFYNVSDGIANPWRREIRKILFREADEIVSKYKSALEYLFRTLPRKESYYQSVTQRVEFFDSTLDRSV